MTAKELKDFIKRFLDDSRVILIDRDDDLDFADIEVCKPNGEYAEVKPYYRNKPWVRKS